MRSIWTDPARERVHRRGPRRDPRYLSGRWVESAPVTAAFLRHVYGINASDVFAVGDSGTVVHWDGGSWQVMPTPTRSLLRGVWGSGPRDVFAVGAGGAIMAI
jgi:hypothetical protein